MSPTPSLSTLWSKSWAGTEQKTNGHNPASMSHILGFGGYVPERVMTNDDWAALVDTSDEWITQRTGIK